MSVIQSPIKLNESAGLLPQVRRDDAGPSARFGDVDRPSFADLLDRQRRVERPEEPDPVEQKHPAKAARSERPEPAGREEEIAPQDAAKLERPNHEQPTTRGDKDNDVVTTAEAEDSSAVNESNMEQSNPETTEEVDQDAQALVTAVVVQPTLDIPLSQSTLSTQQATTPDSTQQAASATGQAVPVQPLASGQVTTTGQTSTSGVAIVEQPGLASQAQAQTDAGTDSESDNAKRESPTAAQVKSAASSETGSLAKPAATAATTPLPATEAPAANPSAPNTARIATPTANLATPTEPSADTAADPNVARVSRGLASAIAQRGGSVTLRLTPTDMGTVRIQMQMAGTTLSASFHAESASAHTLLSQQLSSLRQSLEGQGLQVERLTVQSMQAAPSQQSQTGSNAGGQQQQDTTGQQSANDGRSRGQYSQQGGSRRDQTGGEPPRGFSDHFTSHSAADAA